ncbi:A disintegrin and metalloproteinase with thrombospondin motifs 13-like [Dermacentor silvarum]|uniref:A disintegrin and metalloproteinase with thrombospondin motifs 13-like n=1 Tax=Dermacentor silvarum TaxID=543639 RepID=UPI002100D1F7|nr:A disintegrin and metalloproteinase with thrombospondin motifs 13-like [Dermacentor silvarum]
MLGGSSTALITLDGPHVPYYITYQSGDYRCKPYRKSVQYCRTCGAIGHRQEICPSPRKHFCYKCGQDAVLGDHECLPKCKICEEAHETAGKEWCKKKLRPNPPPYQANLRYRSIIQPRVQLVIAAVTITKTLQEEPYMVRVKGYEATRNILNDDTRYKLKEYVNKQPHFQKADIVFLLTGMNLSEWEGGILQHWIGGSAYLGGVCTEWKVGLSEERVGSYYGVYVFAHELAHSLGCDHDGEATLNWPKGHIGSKDCDWNLGFIMSYMFVKPNMYRFSKCCQREIMNVYNRPEYQCLLVRNSLQTRIFSSKLPGSVSSRQTYCQKVYSEYTYVKVDREYPTQGCIVKCFISREWDSRLISAVDGVKCGKGKVCVLGNCTSKAELKAE